MSARRTGHVDPLASLLRWPGRYLVAFYMVHLGLLIALAGLIQHAFRTLPGVARRG